MKNTTFRKKALLSSVAMLLVALVALGSATFAWFTSSTSATAHGINVKTVQSSELKVASKAKYSSFTDNLDYEYSNLAFKPISSADGANWYSGIAASKTSFATNGTYTKETDLKNYVYMEELNIRNYGAAAVNNVTITFDLQETQANSGNYLRVALVPIAAHNGTCSANDFVSHVFGVDEEEEYSAVTSVSTANTKITPSTTYSVSVGNLAGSNGKDFYSTGDTINEKNYQLFVWFEGQDEDCKDANAGNQMPDITFTIGGTTAN